VTATDRRLLPRVATATTYTAQPMVEWVAAAGRWVWSLGSKGKRRIRKWTADKQRLVDETAEAVSDAKDFIRRASPMAASVESASGQIAARMNSVDAEWSRLRPRLVRSTDRHPSDEVQRRGDELAGLVDRLLIALRYMANPITDVKEKAAASESTFKLHDEAKALVDELLEKVRAY
jgi:hypothetical protein